MYGYLAGIRLLVYTLQRESHSLHYLAEQPAILLPTDATSHSVSLDEWIGEKQHVFWTDIGELA